MVLIMVRVGQVRAGARVGASGVNVRAGARVRASGAMVRAGTQC